MPRGPDESGPMWYAQARLAVTQWAAMAWGACTAGEKEVEWHVVLSRVMDRTASFSISLIDFLLEKVDLSGTTDLCIWSDVGTHFRNWAYLGTIAHKYPEKLKINTHVKWGPEAHFKNPCDGKFGELKHALSQTTLKKTIKDVDELKLAYEHFGEFQRNSNPLLPKSNFYSFMPPPKETLKTGKTQ